jgi:hypothetical protein
MPIKRESDTKKIVEYYITRPDGVTKTFEVDQNTPYSESKSRRPGEMFSVGGGSIFKDYSGNNEHWLDYGSHVLESKQDFLAWVHLWGAGGGGYHFDGSTSGGGGGFTQGLVKFKANTPYTIIIGQGGSHGNTTTHGGGGRGHEGGGQGGGLSGIFHNTKYLGKTIWPHHSPPVSAANALVIAGGGGGKGHHSQGHHGGAGGGGGWTGNSAHNTGGGSQTGGGSGGYNNDGVNGGRGSQLGGGHSYSSSWNGGGGGGWYGGGGGGHTGSHYNGGGGGSGHHAYPASVASQSNNALSQFIVTAHTARSGTHHSNNFPDAAMHNTPLATGYGETAGKGGRGVGNNHSEREGANHGKVIITLAPQILEKQQYEFPIHASPQDPNSWSQSY